VRYEGSLKPFSINNKIKLDESIILTLTSTIDWDDSSSKPKALCLISHEDKSYFFYGLRREFLSLNHKYNLRTRHINNMKEMFREINVTIDKDPNVELIVLMMHGNRRQLVFYGSDKDTTTWYCRKNNKSILRLYNITFRSGFSRLKEGAVVVLHSCSTGSGRSERDNIANRIARSAPQVHVISSTMPFCYVCDIASKGACFFSTESLVSYKGNQYDLKTSSVWLEFFKREPNTNFNLEFDLPDKFVKKAKEEFTYHIKPYSKVFEVSFFRDIIERYLDIALDVLLCIGLICLVTIPCCISLKNKYMNV
jgi:hypothetical protein